MWPSLQVSYCTNEIFFSNFLVSLTNPVTGTQVVTSKIKRSLSQKLATYFPSCCDNEIDNCIGISEMWRICKIQDKKYYPPFTFGTWSGVAGRVPVLYMLYLRCDRYYLLRNSSLYNSLSVDKKSIQLSILSMFIVVS